MSKIDFSIIESFLEGKDPQKYITAIEATYSGRAYLVINDPVEGKRIETHKFKSFLWFKPSIRKFLYGGDNNLIREKMSRYGITTKELRTHNDDGFIPHRMKNGFKYLATCDTDYTTLLNFFKDGGVDVYSEQFSKYFITLTPAEQFMIQTGKRLFKGFNSYDEVHRLQFDLETEGLDASRHAIFQIGIRDNRGFELILETKGDTEKEKRQSELRNIIRFFEIIEEIKPDVITAYNSENFDWPYFIRRCERLGVDINDIVITLNPKSKLKRKESKLKLGQESISYLQTNMWGYNILDISHSVRRAQAINSDIKKWSLKYITKFSKVVKPNRVYVPGDKINQIWSDKDNQYWFNEVNGEWGVYDETIDIVIDDNIKLVNGDYIVQRYLLDDLWETEKIDTIYNQASFLLAKILPTSYMRSSTMGTAGQWTLIMQAWSYENDLAVPDFEPKRKFTGGLSRLLVVGYASGKGIVKFDFAALYPKTQLTWKIFPDLDITGVMDGLLTYVVDKRDEFKFLTSEHYEKGDDLQKLLDDNIHRLNSDRINNAKKMIDYEYKLSSDYDKKQLPLKILANSWFGSYGAPYLFPWGDTNCAEETTCRGRQSLRLMIRFFKEKYNFVPLVLDTDGCNFIIPDNIDDITYVVKASHWKTKKYKPNTELVGLAAVLAEFNETYMEGRMGLDIDAIYDSAINFKRKNYANKVKGKVKLVGNSIKSKAMPIYIEEFINEGVALLLDGNGKDFISLYYETIDKIYNYQIPLIKIASKSRIKMSLDEYANNYCNKKTKAGRLNSRQAHMELAIKNKLNVDLGDTIYYVNTGISKSNSDIRITTNKETKKREVVFNCQLIPQDEIESGDVTTNVEYNVAKYIDSLNKRITPLLVCFNRDIRDNILINIIKDKKTKQLILKERSIFTEEACKLISGEPLEAEDQDDYHADLMVMEDREISFWLSVNKTPNFISDEEWDNVVKDYHHRMVIAKLDGIKNEKEFINDFLMKMETSQYDDIINKGKLPIEIDNLVTGEDALYSKKWGEKLYDTDIIFKYEKEAKVRGKWYIDNGYDSNDKKSYDAWLDYKFITKNMSGSTVVELLNVEA
jgi:DNA polymerase elongation subunit (family B)